LIITKLSGDVTASRFIMRKYWTMQWENHVFEYIYIYIFYTHVRDAYANGIVKEKKRKRKGWSSIIKLKYTKWIKVTLKLGICYKVQNDGFRVMDNSEQIWFHQKEWVEAEEGSLSQARILICPEGNPPCGDAIWSWTHPRIWL